jgi:hypothetical protein
MAAKEILVKKYVARLSDDEGEQLAPLIRKGSSPAHRLLKARIKPAKAGTSPLLSASCHRYRDFSHHVRGPNFR